MTEIDKANEGKRVELVHTDDPYTKLHPGCPKCAPCEPEELPEWVRRRRAGEEAHPWDVDAWARGMGGRGT